MNILLKSKSNVKIWIKLKYHKIELKMLKPQGHDPTIEKRTKVTLDGLSKF